MEDKLFSEDDWKRIDDILLTELFTVKEVVGVVNEVRSKYLQDKEIINEEDQISFGRYAQEFNTHFGFCLPDSKHRLHRYEEGILEDRSFKMRLWDKEVIDETFSVDIRRLIITRERLIRGDKHSAPLERLLYDDSKNSLTLFFDYGPVETSFEGLSWIQKIKTRKERKNLESAYINLMAKSVGLNLISYNG